MFFHLDKMFKLDLTRAKQLGFTLLEIMIILLIAATLLGFAVQSYRASLLKTQINSAIKDINNIETAIENYYIENGYKYPPNLAAIKMDTMLDPWGHPYSYLNIDALSDKGQNPATRKDKNLYPLNSDYDLFSMGADGKTKISLTATESKDDVVRASNGSFVGLGSDY